MSGIRATYQSKRIVLPVLLLLAACEGGNAPDPTGPQTPPETSPSTPPPPRTGQVAFWTDNADLVPITVRVNDQSVGKISAAFASEPTCGQAGTITITLAVGSHSFTGSNSAGIEWEGTVDVEAGRCTTMRLYTTNSPPPTNRTGQVIFWTDSAALVPITVQTNGQAAGSVSAAFASEPNCGQTGGATVTLPAGTYAFTAASAAGLQWEGTVDVEAGRCATMRLYSTTTPPPPPPSSTGQVIVWTDDADLVPISVQINGQSAGNVTSAFASEPACGQSGGATVTLPSGSHTFTASNTSGVRWEGEVEVSPEACTTMRLYTTGGTTPPPTGGGSATVVVTNELLGPVNLSIDGTVAGSVPAQSARQVQVPAGHPVTLAWSLIRPTIGGRAIGDPMGGSFEPIANPTGTIDVTIDNLAGSQWYFAPLITNAGSQRWLMGVNMGLQSENRCDCVVAPGSVRTYIGYYRLYSNSNVQAYLDGSNYSGQYFFWSNFNVGRGSGAVTLTP
jgi:hypothetical protein